MAVAPCRDLRQVKYHLDWKVSAQNVWPTGEGNARLGAHHSGGMNVTYADGHAKFAKNPPADCSSWVPGMPSNTVKISASASGACRPSGQPESWCD